MGFQLKDFYNRLGEHNKKLFVDSYANSLIEMFKKWFRRRMIFIMILILNLKSFLEHLNSEFALLRSNNVLQYSPSLSYKSFK